jgi:hypothetical protein
MYVAVIVIAVLALAGGRAQGQSELKEKSDKAPAESRDHGGTEHEFHRNHFGGFLGASTHSDTDETAFTLGLEYARQFTPRWAVAVYTEQVGGDLERDIIFLVGAVFYPIPGLGLVAAPGVEFANKDVDHHGQVVKEEETEFMLRLGATYGFPLGQASLGPAVFLDTGDNRWTLVYGFGMVTGF